MSNSDASFFELFFINNCFCKSQTMNDDGGINEMNYLEPEIINQNIESFKIGFNLDQMKNQKKNIQDYKLLRVIGEGGQGQVFLVQDQRGKMQAIKAMEKTKIINQSQTQHVMNEFFILAHLGHPLIIRLFGQDHDSKYIYMIMEYVKGIELFRHLRENVRFNESTSIFYTAQIVNIFEYMNNMDLIYRDLKPENIIIDFEGYLRLVDFGFTKQVPGVTQTLCGTPNQVAPEIILNKGHGKPVDWWALGVFIYEMLMGIDPFGDSDVTKIYENVMDCKVRFTRSFPPEAKNLIKNLLVKETHMRLGALLNRPTDVKVHPWFKDQEWVKVSAKLLQPPFIPDSKEYLVNLESEVACLKQSEPIEQYFDPFYEW